MDIADGGFGPMTARIRPEGPFASPPEAISREKQLKNWRRGWKIRLIEEANPDWSDLSHLLRTAVILGSDPRRGDVWLRSPTAACHRNNWRRIFRRIAASSQHSGRQGTRLAQR